MSITLHGVTSTIRDDRDNRTIFIPGIVAEADGDLTVTAMASNFKKLLICAGYHPKCVDECFNTDDPWFIDEDVDKSPR